MKRRKIITGIYGGSFNPIHLGHVRLGETLVRDGLMDELWLLVSPQNPFKADQDLLADDERLRLARLAVSGHPKLQVCDAEFRMPRPSYMVFTLEALRRQHPEREFVLVIGADNWERFPQWHKSDEILRHHRLVILPRPGYALDGLPDGITVARTPLLDISSTQIRQNIARGGYRGKGLPRAVWHEIRKMGYYASRAKNETANTRN
ncbi:MAG: nicotinate-nucleotide adenylyltransferase [Bacteroidaceae bacterium]|nr:nicotinate-nucleotide adenylyltransferase [Bacteroidaceae bacterium]MBQ4003003.1 nicotinate-nucleotide adenylyltransferase [Bacteroidaceae bacterium]